MLEKELREIIRITWPKLGPWAEPHWIEPARGSTVGLPDVELPLTPRVMLPVELKIGQLAGKVGGGELVPDARYLDRKYNVKLRPSQIRYHTVNEDVGRRSATFAWIEDTDIFCMWPWHHVGSHGVRLLTRRDGRDRRRVNAEWIVEIMESDYFWDHRDGGPHVELCHGVEPWL